MLPSLILLMKAKPAPLSVIVSPRASSDLIISISFGRPFLWANIKSSSPICPPRSFDISTLCEFSVQKRIWKKLIDGKLFVTTRTELIFQEKTKKKQVNFFWRPPHNSIYILSPFLLAPHMLFHFRLERLLNFLTLCNFAAKIDKNHFPFSCVQRFD